MPTLPEALAERDQILMAMDIDAAKAFIAKHGGYVPRGKIDWTRVLHLARFEVQTMPHEAIWESRMWLAKNGAQSVGTLPETSPYLRAAIDLIFPKDIMDAYLEARR
jgi:hypothetical protein